MPYIIAEPCINVKDKACVEVCPVDCIYEGDTMLFIHPDECIDCGACVPGEGDLRGRRDARSVEELHRVEQAVFQGPSRGQAGDQGLTAHAPRQHARPAVHSPECGGPESFAKTALRDWHVGCECEGSWPRYPDRLRYHRRRPAAIMARSSSSSDGSSKRRSTRRAAIAPTRRAPSACSGRTSCGSSAIWASPRRHRPRAGGAPQRSG